MRFQFKASEEKILRLKDVVGVVQLAEAGKDTSNVQVFRSGLYAHPWYGEMAITPRVLSDMANNWKNNVRRQDLAVDYFHESDKEAAGWITNLFTDNGGTELWATVQWTPKAQKMLAEKEVRYFSADFAFEWTDPETGVSYKNVLFGGGLVNRPFVKDMQPVVELSEGNQMKTVEQLQAEIKTLSEQHADQVKKLGEQLTAKDSEIVELKGKIALAEKAKEEAAHAAKFDELVKNGKACAAQKDSWMAKDYVKFAELAQPLNVKPAGNGSEGDSVKADGTYALSEEEKAMCKKFDLSEAEYCKANPKK